MRKYLSLMLALAVLTATVVSAQAKDIGRAMAEKTMTTVAPSAKNYIMASYSSAQGWDLRRMADDSVIKAGGIDTTAADGTRYVKPYNSVSFTGTPEEGMLQTTPTGLQIYLSGAWGAVTGASEPLQAEIDALSAQVADLIVAMEAAGIDVTPEAFTFTDATDVALNSTIVSNPITVTGVNAQVPISVTGGEFDVNGSDIWQTASGYVSLNETIRARHTSSASNSTATNTTVTIGGVSDTFTSTTVAGAAVVSLCDLDGNGVNDYAFCTGWETGTGILSTGGTGESAFGTESGSGVLAVATDTTLERTKNLTIGAAASSDFIYNGTNLNINSGYVRFLFTASAVSTTNGNTETLLTLRDQGAVNIGNISIHRVGAVSNVRVQAAVSTSTQVDIGTEQPIELNEKYEVVLQWANAANGATTNWTLRKADGTLLYSSGDTTVTTAYEVDVIRLGKQSGSIFAGAIDGITAHNGTITRFY